MALSPPRRKFNAANIALGCAAVFIIAAGLIAWGLVSILRDSHVEFHYAPHGATTQRQAAASPARTMKLAIVLCKFRDKPQETRRPEFYVDYFTRRGTGGQADYWHDVTLGTLDITSSQVFGWLTMNHDSDDVRRLVFPGGRESLVQWGREAARAVGIDLSRFNAVVVIHNWGVDHGMAGSGVVFVDQDPNLIEPTFVSHEMGHLFGLPHSFGEPGVAPCIRGNGEYCDAWDIMSAMNVHSYTGSFEDLSGRTGPGVNVFAARALGALPPGRVRTLHDSDEVRVELAPLNQPLQEGMTYAIEVPPYTIEYRQKEGWDQGLPSDAVLVHSEKNGRSYLEKTPDDRGLQASDHFESDPPRFQLDVESIDRNANRAVVHVKVVKSSAP